MSTRLRHFKESLLTCPKCKKCLEPVLLTKNEDGSQDVWWTCTGLKEGSCTFPLDMPQEVYWVKRSSQDIDDNTVPPPDIAILPVQYQSLYPALFPAGRYVLSHDSRQSSLESSRSSVDSATSSVGSDQDEQTRQEIARRMKVLRKPRLHLTNVSKQIPSLHSSALEKSTIAMENKYNQNNSSFTISHTLRDGRQKLNKEGSKLIKLQIAKLLSGKYDARVFKQQLPERNIRDIRRAIVAHVKRRRAARAKMDRSGISQSIQSFDISNIEDLVRAKLAKNKREYNRQRLEHARSASTTRPDHLNLSSTSVQSLPGYDHYDNNHHLHHPSLDRDGKRSESIDRYAPTPTYVEGASSPGSYLGSEGQSSYDGMGLNGIASPAYSLSGPDQMMDVYGNDSMNDLYDDVNMDQVMPEDLEGIEGDADFTAAFTDAFGDANNLDLSAFF